MIALRELFNSTHGEAWLRNDRWLEGEPCIDSWYGVVCCPNAFPHVSTDLSDCLASKDDLTNAQPSFGVDPPESRALTGRRWLQASTACHSGNYTGELEHDEARCSVVGLVLSNNNLSGTLPASLFQRASLSFLTVLDLRNNSLHGSLPIDTDYAGTFRRLEFSSNAFEYPPPPQLLAVCLSGEIFCEGYPPESCDAFGPTYVTKTDVPTQCVACEEPWISILLTVLVLVLFILMLAGYAYFMAHHEGLTTQGVSTISIVITHLQTVLILSKIRLAWPPSTKVLFAFLIVDGLNLEGTRPECLFQGSTGLPLFFIFSITRVSLPLLLLLLVGAVRWVFAFLWERNYLRRARQQQSAIIDKLERLETLVFSLPLTGSWRGTFELIRAINSGTDEGKQSLARTGGVIAIILFVCQMLFMIKYGFFTWLMLRLERDETLRLNGLHRARARRDDMALLPSEILSVRAISKRVTAASRDITDRYSREIGVQRMRVRTSYTCKRFGEHAPYWQFVLWVRQFGMTLITLLPAILAHTGSVAEEDYIRGNADSLLAMQSSLSLFLIAFAGVVHWRIKPFAFAFQNWLEMWLLGASWTILFLATIYSLSRGQAEGIILEVLLTTVLLLSLIASAAYLVIHYRSFLREKAAQKAADMMEAARSLGRSVSSFVYSEASQSKRRSSQHRRQTSSAGEGGKAVSSMGVVLEAGGRTLFEFSDGRGHMVEFQLRNTSQVNVEESIPRVATANVISAPEPNAPIRMSERNRKVVFAEVPHDELMSSSRASHRGRSRVSELSSSRSSQASSTRVSQMSSSRGSQQDDETTASNKTCPVRHSWRPKPPPLAPPSFV